MQCICHHCAVPELNYFVDNGVNITAEVDGPKKALGDFRKILAFLDGAKVPYHDVHVPAPSSFFRLDRGYREDDCYLS